MTQSGICKLGDFGSAIIDGEAAPSQIDLNIIRTPLYLAPEII